MIKSVGINTLSLPQPYHDLWLIALNHCLKIKLFLLILDSRGIEDLNISLQTGFFLQVLFMAKSHKIGHIVLTIP